MQDPRIILKFCDVILYGSLLEADSSKNIVRFIYDNDHSCYLAKKLCCAILKTMESKTLQKSAISQADCDRLLSPCIELMLGAGRPFRMKYSTDLEMAFASVRLALTKSDPRMDSKLQFFRLIRQYFITLTRDQLVAMVADEDSFSSVAVIRRPAANSATDHLMDACIFLVDSDVNLAVTRVAALTREVFSCPLATALLSEDAMSRLCRWPRLKAMLTLMGEEQQALPPSPNEAFHSGQWMLGNAASFAPFLCPTVSAGDVAQGPDEEQLNSTLIEFLIVIKKLLNRYHIPGILNGRGGVLWSRSGNQLNASGIPRSLCSQLLALFHDNFLLSMLKYALVPLKVDLSQFGSPEDIREIAEALQHAGGGVVAKEAKEAAAEEDLWFAAKWAQRLFKSVTKAVSWSAVTSRQGTTRSSAFSSPEMKSDPGSEANPIKEVSLPLVSSLCELWAVVLPAAAAAPVKSHPWKALTTLSFSPQCISLLWTARLALGGPEAAVVGYPNRRFPSGFDVKDGANAALDCLCACLSICLVALDDSELFDHKVWSVTKKKQKRDSLLHLSETVTFTAHLTSDSHVETYSIRRPPGGPKSSSS